MSSLQPTMWSRSLPKSRPSQSCSPSIARSTWRRHDRWSRVLWRNITSAARSTSSRAVWRYERSERSTTPLSFWMRGTWSSFWPEAYRCHRRSRFSKMRWQPTSLKFEIWCATKSVLWSGDSESWTRTSQPSRLWSCWLNATSWFRKTRWVRWDRTRIWRRCVAWWKIAWLIFIQSITSKSFSLSRNWWRIRNLQSRTEIAFCLTSKSARWVNEENHSRLRTKARNRTHRSHRHKKRARWTCRLRAKSIFWENRSRSGLSKSEERRNSAKSKMRKC